MRAGGEELLPALAANGIRLLELSELEPADLEWVEEYYHTQVAAGADAAGD